MCACVVGELWVESSWGHPLCREQTGVKEISVGQVGQPHFVGQQNRESMKPLLPGKHSAQDPSRNLSSIISQTRLLWIPQRTPL